MLNTKHANINTAWKIRVYTTTIESNWLKSGLNVCIHWQDLVHAAYIS